MNRVARLSKQFLYHNNNTTIHYILSQRVSVIEDRVNYFESSEHDGTLWIENLEALVYSGYDIARCLDGNSPLKALIRNLPSLPTQETRYSENAANTALSLGGRISIVNRPDALEPVIRDMRLRFCVLHSSDKLSLRAVLHQPDLKCEDITSILGFSSYTESNISATFSGITGIAWAPFREPNVSQTPPSEPLPAGDQIKSESETETSAEPAASETLPTLEHVPSDTIQYIAELTEDQSFAHDNLWKVLRKKRITASLFGIVLKAIDGNRYSNSLFNNLLNVYDLSNVAAIKWGNENEDNAKLAYETETGVKVQSSGLWLHSSGILGASPDGLLPDGKGLVEFKCPYSLREVAVEDAIGSNPRFYLKRSEDGTVYLDKDHAYYHQIQGMLYIIGREYCDFCVWTPVCKPYILRIDKDPAWEACLAKLITFYFKQFLPRITGNDDEKCLYNEYLAMVAVIDEVMEDSKKKREDRRRRRGEVVEEQLQIFSHSEIKDLPALKHDDIVKIAALTSSPFERSQSKLWYTMREHRLTSSSFHLVLSAVARDSYPVSLFKSIMDEYYMSNTAAGKFTRASTVSAIERYEEERGVAALPSGIWLDSSGLLGASVTGLLPDAQGILDVRCLFKYKDILDIGKVVALNDPNVHLEESESGALRVKTSHRIYPKIQAALYFSGRTYCDTITWTQNIFHVTRVHIDPSWEENLPVIRKFYLEKLFPKLCEKWGYDNVIKDLKRFGSVR